jgi:hypothetical protein
MWGEGVSFAYSCLQLIDMTTEVETLPVAVGRGAEKQERIERNIVGATVAVL